MHRLLPSCCTSDRGPARGEGPLIRTACVLVLTALALVLGMCFWPAAPIVIACMFVGQGALALGIALFLTQLYRGVSSGEHRDV